MEEKVEDEEENTLPQRSSFRATSQFRTIPSMLGRKASLSLKEARLASPGTKVAAAARCMRK